LLNLRLPMFTLARTGGLLPVQLDGPHRNALEYPLRSQLTESGLRARRKCRQPRQKHWQFLWHDCPAHRKRDTRAQRWLATATKLWKRRTVSWREGIDKRLSRPHPNPDRCRCGRARNAGRGRVKEIQTRSTLLNRKGGTEVSD
jgi:hypothetical protein